MLQSVSPKQDLKQERPAATPAGPQRAPRHSTWAPLTVTAFRLIWIANLFANLGTWAQSVAAAWVVTSSHASSTTVALIQVAASLPLVMLSIAAGVLADNYDRRRIMLIGQSIEMSGTIVLTVMSFLHLLDPVWLILLTFWISLGGAVTVPAWQAAVGEQVPKAMVADAVLLNSVNYNVARAVGPAIGGLMLAGLGPAWVFFSNTLAYVGLLWALWRWHRPPHEWRLPPERLHEGMVAAIRFARYSGVTRIVMLRSFLFGLAASSIWALLPLLAHQSIKGGSLVYGALLGSLGTGAILGSTQVGRARQVLGSSRLVSLAGAIFALILLVTGITSSLALLMPALVIAGGAWIAALSTYNTVVQVLVPEWVKARALALYQTALFGGLSLGSFLWGILADIIGIEEALLVSGGAMLLLAAACYRLRLPELTAFDVTPALPHSTASEPMPPDLDTRRGAVLVIIEYTILQDQQRAFLRAVRDLRRVRLRNGATRWALYRDINRPGIWEEIYTVDSWLQHLRMLDRLTVSDQQIIDRVAAFHHSDDPPLVRRAVSYVSRNA